MEYKDLPSSVKHSANLGLRDPEGTGSPIDADEAVRQFEQGRVVAAAILQQSVAPILQRSVAPMNISESAKLAKGSKEHSELGDYPDDPTYIR